MIKAKLLEVFTISHKGSVPDVAYALLNFMFFTTAINTVIIIHHTFVNINLAVMNALRADFFL